MIVATNTVSRSSSFSCSPKQQLGADMQDTNGAADHFEAKAAPGGGFIFNTVHNIQADVPPENILAMWEALQEFGTYP